MPNSVIPMIAGMSRRLFAAAAPDMAFAEALCAGQQPAGVIVDPESKLGLED